MTFHIDTVTQCPGKTHVKMTGTINGQPRVVDFYTEELGLEISSDQWREAAIQRMRSACKEAGATTPAACKAVLEGSTYQV